MPHASVTLDRRTVLRGAGVLGLLAALPACSASFADTRLTIGTGSAQGVYFAMGMALGQVWQEQLRLTTPPVIRNTAGSGENLALLASGAADVVFAQVDAASEELKRTDAQDPRALRALSRIYDEYVQVVVPRDAPVQKLADLRGKRVSIGATDSGVIVVAKRLLAVAGLSTPGDLQSMSLGLDDSAKALHAGQIDAFFWTGGLPTKGITDLAATMPVRLLDLSDALPKLRGDHPGEYEQGTVPAPLYGATKIVPVVLVRDFLLVRAGMPDDLAHALVATLFQQQERLAAATPSAMTINLQAAISTTPVPLHPGAERYFREAKP